MIFEAFSQADISIARDFGGTGLGLTIASRLVRLMGGELRLESREGRGSRFHFELELAALEPPEPPPRPLGPRRGGLGGEPRPGSRDRGRPAGASPGLRPARARGHGLGPGVEPGAPHPRLLARARLRGRRSAAALRLGPARGPGAGGRPGGPGGDDARPGAGDLRAPVRLEAARRARGDLPRGQAADRAPAGHRRLPGRDWRPGCCSPRTTRSTRSCSASSCEEFGIAVDIASDGGEAVAMFDGRRYDLVLMDVSMPVVDGVEATQRMLEHREPQASSPHADRGPHGPRPQGRPREAPAGGHGRLPAQADRLQQPLPAPAPLPAGRRGPAGRAPAPRRRGKPGRALLVPHPAGDRAWSAPTPSGWWRASSRPRPTPCSAWSARRAPATSTRSSAAPTASRARRATSGSRPVSDAARRIEQSARAGAIADVAALVEALRQEVLSSRAALFGDAAAPVGV